MNRIVVPSDFTPNARHALERAAMIARAAGVREHRIVSGRRVASVAAAAGDADLLVIGAPQRRWLLHPMLGSTTRLLRNTRSAVLIVRTFPVLPYRDVLVAVDLAASPDKAFAVARAVAPRASLHVVHAYRAPLEGKLAYAGVSPDTIEAHREEALRSAISGMSGVLQSQAALSRLTAHVVRGHAASAVLDKERRLRTDLIVVSRPAKSLVEEWLVPSVTSRLAEEANGDVLIVQQ